MTLSAQVLRGVTGHSGKKGSEGKLRGWVKGSDRTLRGKGSEGTLRGWVKGSDRTLRG